MRFSSPLQEEPIVTLQAAFVGRDGFVIASDTKALGGFLYRSSATNKILIGAKSNIVCAFSGNDLSAAIAQRLVDSAPDEFESDYAIATFLLTKGDEFAKRLGKDPSGQLIIAAVPHIHKLWRVFFFNEPAVTTIETKVYGGDEKNSAVFLGERYYSKSLSVKELTILASHIVLEGHHRNGLEVEGLEVFVCQDEISPRFLTEYELENLRRRSDAIHREFSEVLYR